MGCFSSKKRRKKPTEVMPPNPPTPPNVNPPKTHKQRLLQSHEKVKFLWICADDPTQSLTIEVPESSLPTMTYDQLVDKCYEAVAKIHNTSEMQVIKCGFDLDPESVYGEAELASSATGIGLGNLIDRQPFHFRLAMEQIGVKHSKKIRIFWANDDLYYVPYDCNDTTMDLKIKLLAIANPTFKRVTSRKKPDDILMLTEDQLCLRDQQVLSKFGVSHKSQLFIELMKRNMTKDENEAEFVNVANTKAIQHIGFANDNGKVLGEPTDFAPKWRQASRGLNLEGFCTNTQCPSFKKSAVLMPWGYGTFDLLNGNNDEKLRCPVCDTKIVPECCGFADCYYRWWGIQKLPNQPPTKEQQQTYKLIGPEYQRFDKDLGETLNWLNLKIRTRHRFEGEDIRCPICRKKIDPVRFKHKYQGEEMTCKHMIHPECKKLLAKAQLENLACAMCHLQ